MGLSPEQKKLYKEIDEILWNDWDPIGVNDIEDARDEYQSYTDTIFGLKIHGASKEIIARKLLSIETEMMGFWGGEEKCSIVAEKIMDL